MSDFSDGVAAMWAEFDEAGMLSTATVTSGGTTFDIKVGFAQPDIDRNNRGSVSRDYEIEYQHADAPTLAAGDAMTIVDADGNAQGSYRVRQSPYNKQLNNAADGIFMCALLTKA